MRRILILLLLFPFVFACQEGHKSPYSPNSDSAKVMKSKSAYETNSYQKSADTTHLFVSNDSLPPNRMPAAFNPPMAPNPSGREQCKNDWLLVPGKRAGVLTPATTYGDLVQCFGEKNLPGAKVANGKGVDMPATLLYQDTPNELEVVWANSEKTKIDHVVVRKRGSNWHTEQRFRMGTPLSAIEALNGMPVVLGTLGGQNGGQIVGFGQGRLAKLAGKAAIRLFVGNPNVASQHKLEPYANAKQTPSSAKGIHEANLKVYMMEMQF